MIKPAYAQISSSTFNVSETFGNISGFGSFFNFLYNLFVYLGWSMVLIGISASLFVAVFNISKSDSSDNFENAKGAIVKLVLIVITGLLLLSGAFVINFVAQLFGTTFVLEIPSELGP